MVLYMVKSSNKAVSAVLVILVLLSLAAFSCSKPAPTPAPTAGAVAAGPTPTPAPTPTMLPLRWKMSGYGGPTYPIRIMQENLVKILDRNSNGQIKVEYFPAESLVKLSQGFDAVKDNLVQIGLTPATYEPARMGIVADVANMPWNWDETTFGLNYRKPGSIYDWSEPYFQKNGLHLLIWPAVGHGCIFSRTPVRKLEDLKGKMVGVSAAYAPAITLLGGTSSFVATSEMYQALQRGTIDAGVLTVSSVRGSKYYEVAPYVSDFNLYSGQLTMTMNLDFYNSLRPDVRKILDDSVSQAETEYYQMVKGQYEDDIAFLKSQPKVQVFTLEGDELARWKQAIDPVYGDLAKKYGAEWTAFEKAWKTVQ